MADNMGESAGPSDILRRIEAAAAYVVDCTAQLDDARNARDLLIVHAVELYCERGNTGRGALSTRQIARAARISQGQVQKIMAAT
jgi:hypothetical protein